MKPAIDEVHCMAHAAALEGYVRDPTNPSEARLSAAARIEALWQLAAENREVRPYVSLTMLHAATAGLNSLRWRDP